MLTTFLLEEIILVNRLSFIIYIALAMVGGWILRTLTRKRFWHRFWEHDDIQRRTYAYPQRGHTYVEYVPELKKRTNKQSYRYSESVTPPENLPEQKPRRDDLTIVEGISSYIQSILYQAGMNRLYHLAQSSPDEIKNVLLKYDQKLATHDPQAWPRQAQLFLDGNYNELKRYQEFLKAGRKQ